MSDVLITLKLDAAQLKAGVDSANAKLGTIPKEKKTELKADTASISSGLATLQKQMLSFAAGAFALNEVWETVSKAFNTSITEARDAAQAQRVLNSQMEATGGAAGYTAKQLTEMSNELDNLSNFDNDELLTNMTIPLTTFRNISGEVFQEAQRNILKIAAVIGNPDDPQSLRGATIQLGKALNDPIKGLSMLSRSGIQFSESQTATIKNLVETNRLAEAQGLILKEVSTQFGDAAAASVDSSSLIIKEWKQMLESVGTNTLPVLDGVNLAFAGFFEVMTSNMDTYAEHQSNTFANVFADWNNFSTAFILNFRVIGDVVIHTGSAISGVIQNMIEIPLSTLKAHMKTVLSVFNTLPKAVMDAVSMGDMEAFKNLATGIGDNYKKVGTDAKVFAQTLNAEINAALSSLRSYERDYEAITGKSKERYDKMQALQKSLKDYLENEGDASTGGGGAGAVEKKQSDYDKLLDVIKGYYLDVKTQTMTSYGKELVMLEEQHQKEAEIITNAYANKEIDKKESDDRLLELDGLYGQKSQAILAQINSDIANDRRALEADEVRAKAETAAKKLTDEETYYNAMQFLDQSYFDWKMAQYKKEVELMAITEQQKTDLLSKMASDLETSLGESNSASAGGGSGSWFFGSVLGYDPGNPADQEKIAAIKQTYSSVMSGAQNIVSGMISLNRQRKDEDLLRIDELAAKEKWSSEKTLVEKKKVNAQYAAEERKLKNIQKTLSIVQATINTAQGVTAALTLPPPLSFIMASIVGAMGAAQIALISAQKFAEGGLFRGKGGKKDDQNLIAISDGEFIINADATQRYLPILEQLNSYKGYAEGGAVSGSSSSSGSLEPLPVVDVKVDKTIETLISLRNSVDKGFLTLNQSIEMRWKLLASYMEVLVQASYATAKSSKTTANASDNNLINMLFGGVVGPVIGFLRRIFNFASGGYVNGIGGATEDANLAFLSNGEYVMNAAATKRYLPLLDAINYGGAAASIVPKMAYAGGGAVSGGMNIGGKLDKLIESVQIMNLNLVKKKLGVVVQNSTAVSSLVREIDTVRAGMERGGYVPFIPAR